jgi:hypothetical protein
MVRFFVSWNVPRGERAGWSGGSFLTAKAKTTVAKVIIVTEY